MRALFLHSRSFTKLIQILRQHDLQTGTRPSMRLGGCTGDVVTGLVDHVAAHFTSGDRMDLIQT